MQKVQKRTSKKAVGKTKKSQRPQKPAKRGKK